MLKSLGFGFRAQGPLEGMGEGLVLLVLRVIGFGPENARSVLHYFRSALASIYVPYNIATPAALIHRFRVVVCLRPK